MASALCLDASVLVKLYVVEVESDEAERLVDEALDREMDLVGPALLHAEVLSVLQGHLHRGAMTSAQADVALNAFFRLSIDLVHDRHMYERAWQIAGELSVPVVYDAVYLAVAELRGAEFWTADRKLYDKARGRPYVHLLGEQNRLPGSPSRVLSPSPRPAGSPRRGLPARR